jgi:hypothetical protein
VTTCLLVGFLRGPVAAPVHFALALASFVRGGLLLVGGCCERRFRCCSFRVVVLAVVAVASLVLCFRFYSARDVTSTVTVARSPDAIIAITPTSFLQYEHHT